MPCRRLNKAVRINNLRPSLAIPLQDVLEEVGSQLLAGLRRGGRLAVVRWHVGAGLCLPWCRGSRHSSPSTSPLSRPLLLCLLQLLQQEIVDETDQCELPLWRAGVVGYWAC